MLANVDLFASWETIEILKGFLSVIYVFPGGFHVQGSGRESKHTFTTHVHTCYTAVSDLLGVSQAGTVTLDGPPQKKVPPPTTQRRGREHSTASEVLTSTPSRGYMCMLTSTEEIRICASLSCLSSLPPWLPVE